MERGHLGSCLARHAAGRRCGRRGDARGRHPVARWRGRPGRERAAFGNGGEIGGHLEAVGGWQWAAETSFSAWGERGVIDLLAWHAGRCCLLVIELKTELVDPAALLAQVGRYRRVAPAVARERGWGTESPKTLRNSVAPNRVVSSARSVASGRAVGSGDVACWVVVADTSSNRARLARHRALLRGTFPVDGRKMAGWVADPREPVMGLSFLREMHGRTGTRLGPVRRVRGQLTPAAAARSSSVARPGNTGRDRRLPAAGNPRRLPKSPGRTRRRSAGRGCPAGRGPGRRDRSGSRW